MNKIELKPGTVARIKGLLKKYSIKRVQLETGYAAGTINRIMNGNYIVVEKVVKPQNKKLFNWNNYPTGLL